MALPGLLSLIRSSISAYVLATTPDLQGRIADFVFSVIGAAIGAMMLYAGIATIRRQPRWRRWASAFAILVLAGGGLGVLSAWRTNPLPYLLFVAIGVFILWSMQQEPKDP